MLYKFELIEGKENQIKILYELLKNRIYVISHSEMPEYDEHTKFVKCHPYYKWYLVKQKKEYFGSFYVKNDNSIGLNLNKIDKDIVISCIDFVKKNFSPKKVINSVVPEYFFINVSASNKELINVMQSLNILPLQVSFRI